MRKVNYTYTINVPDIVSILIAVFALCVAIQSLEIVKEPQLQFYLQSDRKALPEGDYERYVFGVENKGIVPVKNLSAKYLTASINRNCTYNEYCEVLDIQEQTFFGKQINISTLKPGEETSANLIAVYPQDRQPDEFIKIIAVLVNYQHNLDKRTETEEIIFLIDGYRVYTLEAAAQVERFKPYINAFWDSFSDSPFFNQKIYWRSFE